MRQAILVLKVITVPVWGPLWLVVKAIRMGWRVFAVLFFAALISGCASTSNKFDKSPCACEFEPLNTSSYGGKADG